MPPNLLQVLAITQNIISDHVLKKKLGGGTWENRLERACNNIANMTHVIFLCATKSTHFIPILDPYFTL